jgi:hypothetical protein
MGGAASKFDETEWDKVDGGLREASETIDGAMPTSHHTILTLKKQSIVNQRDYEIRDDQDILLYTTKAVQGTAKWFDLFGKGGEKLFRVQTDALRDNWDIFAYGEPAFPGQQPDADVTKQAGEPLYRKARVLVTWNKHNGDVHMYGQDTGEGDNDTAGVVQANSILKVEEIRSVTSQFQSYVPSGMDIAHPPLDGHWVWEHTIKTHRIKMNLAKGCDIALHCLLAVMTNMITLERNAAGPL